MSGPDVVESDFPYVHNNNNYGHVAVAEVRVGDTILPRGYVYVRTLFDSELFGYETSAVHLSPERARELAKALKRAARKAEERLARG